MKTSQTSLDKSKDLAALGITLELTPARFNPETKQFDYIGTLSRDLKRFHFDYHTGSAWIVTNVRTMDKMMSKCEDTPGASLDVGKDGKLILRHGSKAYRAEYYKWQAVAPTLADILHSLVLDASADGQDFHSWASDYGYDVDSRKAEATYHACLDNAKKTRALLGDKFDVVAEMLQDY